MISYSQFCARHETHTQGEITQSPMMGIAITTLYQLYESEFASAKRLNKMSSIEKKISFIYYLMPFDTSKRIC